MFSIAFRSPSGMRRQVSLAAFHKIQESARQLTNSSGLVKPDCLSGDQLTAYAESDRSGQDHFGCALLIHAPRGDQRNVREHHMQRSYVGCAAKLGAGNDLDEIRIRLPSTDDL